MTKRRNSPKKSLALLAVLSALTIAQAPNALAWGSYGHQQVNYAAVELIADQAAGNAMSQCIKTNAKMIQRLAISPDYDWKKLGTEIDRNYENVPLSAKKNADGSRIEGYHSSDPRLKSDGFEHPLHYFEVDAFTAPNNIMALPTDLLKKDASGEYEYVKMRFSDERIAFVKAVDPGKADSPPAVEIDIKTHKTKPAEKIDYVRSHGTAPWRIKQLYELGVSNLKSGKVELALIYLGAMGHYVGDMSQPFHTSLNFDGEYDAKGRTPVSSSGIHAAFEAEMFKQIADDPDKATFIYGNFDKTDPGILEFAKKTLKGQGLTTINSSQIVGEVFKLISGSTPYAQPLLDALWVEAENFPVGAGRVKAGDAAATGAKKNASVLGETVLQAAEHRISDSSILLARLWLSAFAEAGVGKSFKCEQYFDGSAENHSAFRRKVVENYPQPKYLPAGHVGAPHHASAHTDTTADHDVVKAGDVPAAPANKEPGKPSAAAVRAFRDDLL